MPTRRRRAAAPLVRPSRRKQRTRPAWQEIPLLVVMALVVAVLVKSFVVQAFYIPSGSMEQTLHGCDSCQGDRVLVNKMSYRVGHIQRGQIVVFRKPAGWPEETTTPPTSPSKRGLLKLAGFVGLGTSNETDFIKRVVGLPGDVVQCCDAQGRVTVNGVAIDESYVFEDNRTEFRTVVPPGDLFVMGDHRGNSLDARRLGPIPIDHVVGRAFVLVYPMHRFKLLPMSTAFTKARVPAAAQSSASGP